MNRTRPAVVVFLSSLILLGFAFVVCSGEEPAPTKPADDVSAARLKVMHEIVSRLRFDSGEGEDRAPLELLSEPIMRYSDAPHGLEDATVWIWCRGERPAVLLKLESYPTFARQPIWSFCLTSTSNGPIAAPFSGGKSWSAKSAAIVPQRLPQAAPAKTPELRLRQLRETARHFTAYRVYGEFGRTELRLLTRPVYRYKSEADGIIDGAVFSIAKDLNPHIALLIEAVDADRGPRWRYSAIRHSDAECHLLLDGEEVWHADRYDVVDSRQPYYWLQWPASDVERVTPMADN